MAYETVECIWGYLQIGNIIFVQSTRHSSIDAHVCVCHTLEQKAKKERPGSLSVLAGTCMPVLFPSYGKILFRIAIKHNGPNSRTFIIFKFK